MRDNSHIVRNAEPRSKLFDHQVLSGEVDVISG